MRNDDIDGRLASSGMCQAAGSAPWAFDCASIARARVKSMRWKAVVVAWALLTNFDRAVAAGCVVVLPLFVRMICGLGFSVFWLLLLRMT